MKTYLGRFSVTAILASALFSAGTHAQGGSNEFVVSGAAAEATLDATSINLATARAIGDRCVELAEERVELQQRMVALSACSYGLRSPCVRDWWIVGLCPHVFLLLS